MSPIAASPLVPLAAVGPPPEPTVPPASQVGRRHLLRAGTGAALAGALATACAGPDAPDAGGDHTRTGREHTPTDRGHATSGHGNGNGNGQGQGHGSAPAPRRFPGRPAQIDHGPRDRRQVALTFHGQGDPATAHAVLAEAERAGARVTVLAVGSWLDEYPRMARRVLDGGHDLGNHTQRHLTVSEMPEGEAYREITDCAQRLRRLTGSIGTWFRPSRTQYATPLVQRLAHRAGYPHVLSYDVDSLDFTSPGATAVTRKVAGEIRNGSVVSLHLGYADTVAALPALLDDLHRRGLRAVTTTELLTP